MPRSPEELWQAYRLKGRLRRNGVAVGWRRGRHPEERVTQECEPDSRRQRDYGDRQHHDTQTRLEWKRPAPGSLTLEDVTRLWQETYGRQIEEMGPDDPRLPGLVPGW